MNLSKKVFEPEDDKKDKYFDEFGHPIIKLCENGHIYSLGAESYCPICGKPFFTKCKKCGTPFYGIDSNDSYCHVCGKLYPWAAKRRRQLLIIWLTVLGITIGCFAFKNWGW